MKLDKHRLAKLSENNVVIMNYHVMFHNASILSLLRGINGTLMQQRKQGTRRKKVQ